MLIGGPDQEPGRQHSNSVLDKEPPHQRAGALYLKLLIEDRRGDGQGCDQQKAVRHGRGTDFLERLYDSVPGLVAKVESANSTQPDR